MIGTVRKKHKSRLILPAFSLYYNFSQKIIAVDEF